MILPMSICLKELCPYLLTSRAFNASIRIMSLGLSRKWSLESNVGCCFVISLWWVGHCEEEWIYTFMSLVRIEFLILSPSTELLRNVSSKMIFPLGCWLCRFKIQCAFVSSLYIVDCLVLVFVLINFLVPRKTHCIISVEWLLSWHLKFSTHNTFYFIYHISYKYLFTGRLSDTNPIYYTLWLYKNQFQSTSVIPHESVYWLDGHSWDSFHP